MKQGWEIKKLGDLCEIKGRIGYRGYTVNDLVEKGEGAITLSPSNIQDNQFNTEKCTYISWFKYNESPEIMVYEGDILFVKTGSTYGKVAIVENLPEKATINPQFVVLKDIKCSNKFLYYALTTTQFKEKVENIIGGAATPTLSQTNLAEQTIVIPKSLPEQQRIVSILDEAFAAIAKAKANAEQNLKNAKELFESYLNSIEADKVDLGSLVDIKTGKLNSNAAVENGKYPFFTCSREVYAIDNYAFDLEAILLAGNNASGDFNVKYYKGKFNAYQRTYVITVNEKQKVLYRYLYFQLLKSLKEFKEMSVGANTRFLKLGMIQGLKIALPTIEDQQTIVRQLDALRAETQKLEAVYQKKMDDLEELKKSILQKAFSGELAEPARELRGGEPVEPKTEKTVAV